MTALTNAVAMQTQVVLGNFAHAGATASATGVDITDYEGQVSVVVNQCYASGSPTTNTITVEHSDSLSSGYTTLNTTTNMVNGTPQRFTYDTNALKRYLRVTLTIAGGSTPYVEACAILTGVKKSY